MNDYNIFYDSDLIVNDYTEYNTLEVEYKLIDELVIIQKKIIEDFLIEQEEKNKTTFKRKLIIEKKGKVFLESYLTYIR